MSTPRGRVGLLGAYVGESDEDSDYQPEVEVDIQDIPLAVRARQKRAQQKGPAPPKKKARAKQQAPPKTARQAVSVASEPDVSESGLLSGHTSSAGGATGDDLPTDMLRIIFPLACATTALPAAAVVPCVCRTWRAVAADLPELWAHLDLSGSTRATNEVVRRNAGSGQWGQVQHFKLGSHKLRTEACLLHLAAHCRNITGLDISGMPESWCPELRAEKLEQAIIAMPALAHLDVSHRIILPRGTGVDRVIRAALTPRPGQSASPIMSLKAAGHLHMTRTTLAALAPHAQAQHQQAGAGGSAAAAVPKLLHLKEVDLSRSGQDSSLQLSIECFQAAAPHLEVLKTSGLGSCFGVQLDAAPPRWQDLPGWPSLRVLELGAGELHGATGTNCINNQALLRMASKSAHLTTLDISGCTLPGLRSDVFAQLPGAASLRVLRLRKCSLGCDEGLHAVAAHCPLLTHLDVGACRGAVGDEGLSVVARACRGLRCLDLEGSSITAKGLASCLRCCLDLEVIDLSACRGLDRGLRQVASDSTSDAVPRFRSESAVPRLRKMLGIQ